MCVFGGLSQIHTIIEIHHQSGFGKGLEEEMFLTNGFPFKNCIPYLIFLLNRISGGAIMQI